MKETITRKRIYLDNAATTPVDLRVLRAMLPYFSREFGNPGGVYKEGVAAKNAVARVRKVAADFLGASPDEIIFTASGTESNNLAILGFAASLESHRYTLSDFHFITSAIEHPSVLDCFKALEKKGAQVSYVPVTREGILDLVAFERALQFNTVLVSVMLVNNEIGTIHPIREISKLLARKQKSKFFQILPMAKPSRILDKVGTNSPDSKAIEDPRQSRDKFQIPVFHSDFSQAPLYLPLKVQNLGIDLLTLDAQKVYGPKGIGLLYKKKGIEITPLFHGGSQEYGLRAGTENVSGIVGFAKALEIAATEREKESARLAKIRDYCIKQILKIAPNAELNGSRTERAPNNINISFPGIESEWLVLQLDAKGIAVGSRSACMSAKESGSYVIAALGKGKEYTTSSIRITLGRSTKKKDIDALVRALQGVLYGGGDL